MNLHQKGAAFLSHLIISPAVWSLIPKRRVETSGIGIVATDGRRGDVSLQVVDEVTAVGGSYIVLQDGRVRIQQ